jgi:NitT/TauT family transport system substrate-binding protein
VLSAGLAFTLALALTGCGGTSDDTPGAGLETTHLTIAAGPVADMAPIHLGLKHGVFKALGLDIELKTFSGGAAAAAALVGGQIDMSFGNYGSVLLARQGGQDLKIVGEASIGATTATGAAGTISVIALPGGSVQTGKDLAGKRISVTSLKGTPTAIIGAALRNIGVDPTTVKFSEVPLPGVGAALTSGAIDAAYVLEPYVTKLGTTLGTRVVLDPLSGQNAGLALNGYAVTGKFATAHPKTIAAFQRALAKAQGLATRAAVQQILPTYIKGMDDQTAKLMALPDFPQGINPTRIQRVADLMVADHQLTKPQTVAEFTIVPAGA